MMKRKQLMVFVLMAIWSLIFTQPVLAAEVLQISQNYGNLPLAFEANEGQTDEQVKFLSRGSGYSLFLTPTETVLSLSKDDRSTAIRMGLVGANPKPQMVGEEKLSGKTNYLKGNDPKKWRTDVSSYKKVRYEEMYPGIDLVYYGNQRKLEYDFIVKPGVDPKAIRMQFAGADRMSVEAGDLILHTDSGDVTQKAPIIYQEIDGKRKKVAGNYMFLADNQVGFHLGEYDRTQPLVIDPILEYSTFLGGGDTDQAWGVTVDTEGNSYITGYTLSTNFPTTSGVYETSKGTFYSDAFITKLNPSGTGLIFSTYLGGSDTDRGHDIAVDNSGYIYIAGHVVTSSATIGAFDFPVTDGAFQTVQGGRGDWFVAKLNPSGSDLIYATYLGGDRCECSNLSGANSSGPQVVVDSSGHAYIAASTTSIDFPTTDGAIQTSLDPVDLASDPRFRNQDIIVAKLNPTGSELVYSTYIGGNDLESPLGLAVDDSGYAYIAGGTSSRNFPTTAGAFQTAFAGGDGDPDFPLPPGASFSKDLFVAKINTTGTGLVYSTYLGGIGNEDHRSGDIAVDSSGHAYVAGSTVSLDFPTTTGAWNTSAGSWRSFKPFVTKLNPTGSGLVYSTRMGGRGSTLVNIELDGEKNAYLVGNSGLYFAQIEPFTSATRGIFVSKLNSTGSEMIYSSILGFGTARAGALDDSNNTYVVGNTRGDKDFPVTTGAFQAVIDTSLTIWDGFVSKINPSSAPVVTADAGPHQTVDEGDLVTLDGTGSSHSLGTALNYDWSQLAPSPAPTVTLGLNDPAKPTFTAPYLTGNKVFTFGLIVGDGTTFSAPDTVDITVVDVNSPPVADAGDDSTIKPGAVAALDGSNSFDPEMDPITYQWSQVSGTAVVLSDDTAKNPTFTAPNAVGNVLVFKLQVSDGKESSTPSAGTDSSQADTVTITIVANSTPTADAGPDQTVDEGTQVTLNGSGSDPDGGDSIFFKWTKVSGPPVTLSNDTASGPTFTAPSVGAGGAVLVFQLVVKDNDPVNPLSSLPDQVTIQVLDVNDPPNCQTANASLDLGWPPNHTMEAVEVENVSDPNNDAVTITINGVTQDEPVSGISNGDSSPDAVIQPNDPADSVLLRLERDARENGRVYVVSFTASDGLDSCNGTITVSVPHSRQSGAVNDGQNFDSTLP
jgi:K319-like protein/beta-propeller repeat-containing protein